MLQGVEVEVDYFVQVPRDYSGHLDQFFVVELSVLIHKFRETDTGEVADRDFIFIGVLHDFRA